MKLLTGCLVLVLFGAATGADAWPWSRSRTPRLPKPIDSPIVRPNSKSHEKATRQQHPKQYMVHGWGEEWNKLKLANLKEGNHSIFRD
jgi:hypothetical protein